MGVYMCQVQARGVCDYKYNMHDWLFTHIYLSNFCTIVSKFWGNPPGASPYFLDMHKLVAVLFTSLQHIINKSVLV